MEFNRKPIDPTPDQTGGNLRPSLWGWTVDARENWSDSGAGGLFITHIDMWDSDKMR